MKITFVVPALNLTGGLRVVSIYANLLSRKGHKVTVVSPNKNPPSLKQWIKSTLNWNGYKFKPKFNSLFFRDVNYELKVLEKHRKVTYEDVPDADIIIATFWNTAEWIAEFPEVKGKKVYFIQHYELHSWLPIERVKATFRLPYKKIVVSKWIGEVLLSQHKSFDITIVPNGVDPEQFFSPIRTKNKHTTFGIMYSSRTYKGCHIAFSAFEKVKLQYPDLQLVAFGSAEPVLELPLPEHTKYYCLPKQVELRDIYASCDAWVFSSTSEGFGLPILEAMACRTPVIGTKCGAAEMLIDNKNGILVDINDIEALATAMITFSEMTSNEWDNYSRSAYLTSTKYRWTETVVMFEDALIAI